MILYIKSLPMFPGPITATLILLKIVTCLILE